MKDKKGVPLFSSSDITRIISMKEAIEAVKEAFVLASEGEIQAPSRIHVDIAAHHGTSLVMPSYIPHIQRFGVKIINLFEDNRSLNLPISHALMIVFNSATGSPLGLLEAGTLTGLRTGAASGIATDLLSRPDAHNLAVFGAGFQAKYQLEAILAVRQIEKVQIYDPDTIRSASFVKEAEASFSLSARAAGSPREAVADADIICTVTTSKTPVFDNSDLKSGVHINAIGSYKPHEREIPSATMTRARVFVDQKNMALEEAGDLLIPLREGRFRDDHILAEIGEVASGKKAGRRNENEITLFKSVGIAAQDIILASRVLEADTETLIFPFFR